MPWMHGLERNCIRAEIRSNRLCISADYRLPTAACTLARLTVSFIVSGCPGNEWERSIMRIRRTSIWAAVFLSGPFLWTGALFAQFGRGGGAWSTANGDPQRTAWVRADPEISKESVQKGVVQFLWKLKLNNETRQLNALTQPVVIG